MRTVCSFSMLRDFVGCTAYFSRGCFPLWSDLGDHDQHLDSAAWVKRRIYLCRGDTSSNLILHTCFWMDAAVDLAERVQQKKISGSYGSRFFVSFIRYCDRSIH